MKAGRGGGDGSEGATPQRRRRLGGLKARVLEDVHLAVPAPAPLESGSTLPTSQHSDGRAAAATTGQDGHGSVGIAKVKEPSGGRKKRGVGG